MKYRNKETGYEVNVDNMYDDCVVYTTSAGKQLVDLRRDFDFKYTPVHTLYVSFDGATFFANAYGFSTYGVKAGRLEVVDGIGEWFDETR